MKELSVLLVDDENRLRERFCCAIASWGFEVGEARSAEEAMRVMQGKAFDISILDLNLPGMGGIELFEKFRGMYPRHQVIVLSGFGNLEAVRAAIRLDVVDFWRSLAIWGNWSSRCIGRRRGFGRWGKWRRRRTWL